MNIPKELFAGDSATWEDDETEDILGGAIDSTWTMKYVIAGSTAVTLTATANGLGWRTSISKTQTETLGAGEFYWQAYAETGTRRETLGRGRITIRQAAVSGASGKTQAQQDLEAVQAAMRAMISGGAVAEYTIGGRSLRKIDMADLIMLEARLKNQVAAEKKAESIANGLGNPSNIFVRFNK